MQSIEEVVQNNKPVNSSEISGSDSYGQDSERMEPAILVAEISKELTEISIACSRAADHHTKSSINAPLVSEKAANALVNAQLTEQANITVKALNTYLNQHRPETLLSSQTSDKVLSIEPNKEINTSAI